MPLAGKHLDAYEVARVAHKVGIPLGEPLVVAVAVAWGESRFWCGAWNFNASTGDQSYGLWQVNMIGKLRAARLLLFKLKKPEDLYDPAINARVMAQISKKGTDWSPWGAYTNGNYKEYLPWARKAAAVVAAEAVNPKPKAVKAVALPWVSQRQIHDAAVSVTGTNGKSGSANSKDDVLLFQKGLAKLVGLDYSNGPGVYGLRTKAATAVFQRKQGWRGPDADGIPGPETVRRVASQSHLFQVRDFIGASAPKKSTPKKGRIASPVPGHKVTYAFGVRNARYAAGYHTGDDYAAAVGTPAVAVLPGTVLWSNPNGGAYGNWIGIRATNGHVYVYCHLSIRSVHAGEAVRAGQAIGKVGATGNVTGPHLHFEMSSGTSWAYGRVRKPTW